MSNILADSLIAIRAKLYTRIWVTALFLLGYALVYRVGGWKLALGVIIINVAGDVRV